jgi:hypothetical protein
MTPTLPSPSTSSGHRLVEGEGRGEGVAAVNARGCSSTSTVWRFTTGDKTAIEYPERAAGFALEQNYPNPFSDLTTIRFAPGTTDARSHLEKVKISVHDRLGREIAVLFDGAAEAGAHEVIFDIRNLRHSIPSGVYFYRLSSSRSIQTRAMVLLPR